MPSYRRLQQYALAISIISVIYNAAEGAVSIAFGAESGSRALIFFGLQSGIEVASALLVIWRFRHVAPAGEERGAVLSDISLKFERTATLSIGILLLCLALATEASAIAALALRNSPDSSNASIIISASALVIMIFIWLPKRYLARALDSSTMKGEATCSLSCIQITVVLFIGSLIYRLWKGGWWVDSATSLVLGLLFGWEGIEMVRWARNEEFNGGCCRDCGDVPTGQPLKEQYRDICPCCATKEECKAAGECKCSEERLECGEAQGCCRPVAESGDQCCTFKSIPQPRPDSVVAPCCSDDGCNRSQRPTPAAPNCDCC